MWTIMREMQSKYRGNLQTVRIDWKAEKNSGVSWEQHFNQKYNITYVILKYLYLLIYYYECIY